MGLVLLMQYLAVIIGIALLARILGRDIMKKIGIELGATSSAERLFFQFVSGLAVESLIVFLLLLCHAFYAGVVYGLAGSYVLYLLVKNRTNVVKWRPVVTAQRAIWGTCTLVIALIVLPLSLHPPIMWDSIEYHLPIAVMNAGLHYLGYNPYLREDFLPQGAEMLMSLIYLLVHSGEAVQLFSGYLFGLLLLGTYALGRRLGGTSTGAFAAALLLGFPLALLLSSSAYSDMYLTVNLFAACYVLVVTTSAQIREAFVLTGIFTGAGLSAKPTAIVMWLIIFVLLLWSYRRHHWRGLASNALYHGAALLGLAMPWYIRDWLLTGNPVYPIATSIFGNAGPWTDSEIRSQIQDYTLGQPGGLLGSPHDLLLVLVNKFGAEGLAHPLSEVLFVGLILSALTAVFWTWPIQRLGFVTAVFFLFAAYESVFLRYSFPIVPLAAVISAVGLSYLLKLHRRLVLASRTWYDTDVSVVYMKRIVITVVSLILIQPGVAYAVSAYRANGIVVNPAHYSTYLVPRLPAYSAFNYLNERYGAHYSVYAIHQENMRYYCEGKMIGDWFGPDSFSRFLGGLSLNNSNVSSVHEEMVSQSIEFILMTSADLKVSRSLLNGRFETIYDSGGYTILKAL